MPNAFKGRLNRRTYIVGNLIALGVLGALVFLIVVPVGILDIILSDKSGGQFVSFLYIFTAIPALAYYFYFIALMIRRAHDIGWPGVYTATGFTAVLIFGQLFNYNYVNLLLILVIIFLAFKKGQKTKNQYGPKPRNQLNKNKLKLHFDGRV